MEANRSTHPKVFISYAWGRNKDRVKELADRLIEHGVSVLIDVYDLKPGMNKHAYMQKLVNDPSIEKVLMLCDSDYKQKADDFSGGVGEEATIISPEVYGKVEQTKFLPVVLERDVNGEPFLPTMAKSLMYIDFSDHKTEPDEYNRLVRNLWGMPDKRKPVLGERPKWLDSASANTASIESLLSAQEALSRRTPVMAGIVARTTQEFIATLNGLQCVRETPIDIMAMIEQTEPIRNCFVRFAECGLAQGEIDGDVIGTAIEKMYNGIVLKELNTGWDEVYEFFFWDVFICSTALLLEYERFADLHLLLNRTYFLRNIIGTNNDPKPYTFTQFRPYCQCLENEYKKKVNPQLITLAGHMLVKRTFGAVVTKRSLAAADLTLAHLAMLYGRSKNDSTWYAMLAPYADYAGCGLVWERFPSRRYCTRLMPLFGVKDMQGLKKVVKEMSAAWDERGRDGYHLHCWGVPGILPPAGTDSMGSLP